MAEVVLWNSQALRRRSASDTFQENGLALLRQYLDERGHAVEIVDWAHGEGYRELAPPWLLKLNRKIAAALIDGKGASRFSAYLAGSLLQPLVLSTQNGRMKSRLKKLARRMAREQIRLVGVKVWYGEAFTWSDYFCRILHRYSPETIVVAGGYHVSLYKEDFLRHSSFDLAVDGPGEEALHYLAELIDSTKGKDDFLLRTGEAREHIPGLIMGGEKAVPAKGNSSLAKRGFPRYPEGNGKVGVHILMDSLGCPWNKCAFCVHNQFSPDYKPRDIDHILDEIRYMRRQGIGLFRFAGSDTPPPFGARIADGIMKEGLILEYSIGCRAVTEGKSGEDFEILADQFARMIRSGLRGIFMGGETGQDIINREMMNKGLTSRDIIYTVKALREAERRAGISVSLSLAFIYPTPLVPGITDEDVKDANLRLMEICHPDAVMITPPGPFKNSDWYKRSGHYGFELGENFIAEMMQYEYVLYKPLSLWPPLSIKLQGRSFKEILAESQTFKKEVEKKLGLFTDLSDEHFLMIRAAGKFHRKGIEEYKRESLLDILSADYTYLDRLGEVVSAYSARLAAL
ncbi:MAG: cobalamin-dependent protein [Spirochaetales bacterium]|nr:cobalamin-dependent protein [Spirochaetales bacterium]